MAKAAIVVEGEAVADRADGAAGTRLDVVAIGEAMIEFNQSRSDHPQNWLQGFGGDTSNAVIAAARLGAHAGYVTRVGDDSFGRYLRELWAREAVDTTGVAVDGGAPTGVYFVAHGGDGHTFSYLRNGSAATRLSSASLPLAVIASARVLHLSAISQAISTTACDACFAAIDAARAAGACIAYDTNLRLALWPLARAKAMIFAALRVADWVLPSLDDARLLFGTGDPAAIADVCHGFGPSVVVVKLGREGCLVSETGSRVHLPGVPVDTVDGTGAGDCFDGAFIARKLAGDDSIAAARYANAAAALATTGYGAVDPLPHAGDVARILGAAR